jgi:hypothetical protein
MKRLVTVYFYFLLASKVLDALHVVVLLLPQATSSAYTVHLVICRQSSPVRAANVVVKGRECACSTMSAHPVNAVVRCTVCKQAALIVNKFFRYHVFCVNTVCTQALLAALHSALEAKLMGANQSRTFYTQSVLPGMHFDAPASTSAVAAAAAVSGTAAQSSSSSKAAAVASRHKRARSSATTASGSGSDSEGGGDAPWQPYDDDDNDVSVDIAL